MSALLFLVPIALFLGALGLGAFLWSMRSGQYDDLEGASRRILLDDDAPLPDRKPNRKEPTSDDKDPPNAERGDAGRRP